MTTSLGYGKATPQLALPTSVSELANLWRLFKRYRVGILLTGTAASLIALLIALSSPTVYMSTAVLLIEPRTDRTTQSQDVYDPAQGELDDYHATQVELLRSRGLAERVVDKLRLAENKALLNDTANQSGLSALLEKFSWTSFLPGLPEPQAEPARTHAQLRELAVQRVQAQTFVVAMPRTRLVRVSFLSSTPEVAQQVATGLAEAYLESGLESRLEAAKRASRWLTDKLGDLSAQLKKSEQALQVFRDANQLVVVGSNRGLVDQEILENSQRLRESQRIKSELGSTYSRILAAGSDSSRLEQLPVLLQDGAVQKARGAVLDSQQAMKQVEERYGSKHPQMAAALNSLQAARRTFHEQLMIAAEGVRSQYQIAVDTERQLSGALTASTTRVRELDRKQYEVSVLEREVDSNRQLYNMFLQRFKETDSAASYEPINARITDAALLPKTPVAPNRPKILVIGLLIGLFFGVLLAAVRHLLSDSIGSVEDLEAVAQVPLFGLVPRVSAKRSTGVMGQFRDGAKTPFAEGVRSVRTAVRLAEAAGRKQCYVITSAAPGEGKSSLSACLGMVLAASEKTLLIEGDLRAPSLRKMLSIPKQQPGLMEVMLGNATLEQAIYTDAGSKLDVLSVNQRPPNPAETVGSMAFAALIEDLRGRYERIIIDCPPVQVASDALVLARLSDAVLFVARADATPVATVRRALHQLHNIEAPLVGCVLNRVDVRRNPDAYGPYQYAYRYYG